MACGAPQTGTHLSLDAAQQRIYLLSEAVEQSARLSNLLARIGHSRFVPAQNPVDTPPVSVAPAPLEHAISTIKSLEEALRRTHPTLCERQNDVLSPVYRLNDDLLRYIFVLPSRENQLAPHQSHFAISVSRVCRRWRALALDTGSMWACVNITVGQRGGLFGFGSSPMGPSLMSSKARVVRIQEGDHEPKPLTMRDEVFLERSKGAELAVNLSLNGAQRWTPVITSPVQNAQNVQTSPPMLNEYIVCASRVQDLQLIISEYATYPDETLLQFIKPCKNVLRRLEISFGTRDNPSEATARAFLMEQFPNLVSLGLNAVPMPAIEGTYSALSSLRSLELHAQRPEQFSADRFYCLLASCPHLQVLRIHAEFAQFDQWPVQAETKGRIRLRHLHTFSLYLAAWTNAATAAFDAPALESLTLSVRSGLAPEEQQSFRQGILSFLRSAPPPLRTLHLREVPSDCAATIFMEVPSVSCLVLAEYPQKSTMSFPQAVGNPFGQALGNSINHGPGLPFGQTFGSFFGQATVAIGVSTPSSPPLPVLSLLIPATPGNPGFNTYGNPRLRSHPVLPQLDTIYLVLPATLDELQDLLAIVESRKQGGTGRGSPADASSGAHSSALTAIRHIDLGFAFYEQRFNAGSEAHMPVLQQLAREVETLSSCDFRFDVEEGDWKQWRDLTDHYETGLGGRWTQQT